MMIDFLKQTRGALLEDRKLVITTIIAHSGSTPRSTGAKMAVRPDGSIIDTIGGGVVEALAIREAVEMLSSNDAARIREYDLTNKQAESTGMICGGGLTVFMQVLGEEDAEAISVALEALRTGSTALFVSELDQPDENGNIATLDTFLLIDGKPVGGTFSAKTLEAVSALSPAPVLPEVRDLGGNSAFLDPVKDSGTLIIVGAGHVSQPTAALAATVGFPTIIMDDREDFASAERFPTADRIVVLDTFKDVFEAQTVTPDTSLVIVTRGHSHDKTVLAQALNTPAGYIGMIGSKKKRDATYDALRLEGFSQEQIDRVFSPIGLSIDAETPEEIAVSIVGELIQERARRRSHAG